VLGLLRGNAATRVLSAHGMGWDVAQQVSGKGWQAALLAELLDDPYSAVRFVAHRSLRTLPGFGNHAYDFLAPAQERRRQRAEVRRLAHARAGEPAPFVITEAVILRELARRADTPISISE
jgi:hypothetical protein